MGMAMPLEPILRVPRVRKVPPHNKWRVTYVDVYNFVCYREYYTWAEAIAFATRGIR